MNRLTQCAILLWVVGLVACGGSSKKATPAFSSSSSVIVLSSSSSSTSSSGTSSSSASSMVPLIVVASGVVADEFGVPVDAASVAVEGTNIVATTDANGGFSVDLSTLTPAVLRISKTGFASTIRAAVSADDNSVFANRVLLHSVGATLNLDAASDNILRVPGSTARVDLPANSLARADGSVFSGAAQVTLTPIDPSENIDFMPGVMVDGGSGIAIESMGAMGVEFTDANGQPLNLGANKTAIIRIPATPAAGVTPPATIPLYHLNEVSGLWEQDGIASLQTDPVSGEQYYEGEVSHFSWWNADQEITRASINYLLTDSSLACNYNTLPSNVTLAVKGVDYLGVQTLSPTSNAPLYAKALAKVQVILLDPFGTLDVIEATMPAAGETLRLPRCLVRPQLVTVSGKVTVSSGNLSGYRVQTTSARGVFTVPIATDGSYSFSMYENTGVMTARLVGGFEQRDTPASSATVTVANASVAFADLVISDEKVFVNGCISGWESYPHPSAQLTIFKDGELIKKLADVSLQNQTFSFVANINQTIALALTPAGSNLREKTVPLTIGLIDTDLGDCIPLPIGPTAAAVASGSGFSRTFNASTSTEGDANIATYQWTFSDGSTAEGQTVSHTFAAFGSYFVTLKVTDALLQSSTTNPIPVTITDNTQTINVKPSLLSSGLLHTCVITTGGGVKCWGNNDAGQLGNGTFYNGVAMEDAAPIAGLSDVVAVSAGGNHSCAITALGALKCWGENSSGQLGNGVGAYGLKSNVPVDVVGLGSGVVAVSLGRSHSCAITAVGAVKCWGANGAGQLGNGTETEINIPVDVIGLSSGAHLISAGNSHSCAATAGAGVLCWGGNGGGALGNSTDTDSTLPVAVTGLTEPVISLAVGYRNSCAVTAVGLVKCWGYNAQGQLGNGTTTDSFAPVQLASLSDIALVSLGESHSCALNSAGYTSCWGYNTYDQLGNDDASWFSSLPVSVNVQQGTAEAISTGGYNACALNADGSVQCWGWDGLYMPGG